MVKGVRTLVNAVLFPILIASLLPVLGQQPQSGTKEPVTKDLRIAPGKPLAAGSNKVPAGPRKLLTYRLEEVQLSEPGELEIGGKKERVESVFRLTITGGESLLTAELIWIDDAAL